jgi:hypothetical protein
MSWRSFRPKKGRRCNRTASSLRLSASRRFALRYWKYIGKKSSNARISAERDGRGLFSRQRGIRVDCRDHLQGSVPFLIRRETDSEDGPVYENLGHVLPGPSFLAQERPVEAGRACALVVLCLELRQSGEGLTVGPPARAVFRYLFSPSGLPLRVQPLEGG